MSPNVSKMSPKCLQNVFKCLQNVSKTSPNVSKCLQNVSKETFSPSTGYTNLKFLTPSLNVSTKYYNYLLKIVQRSLYRVYTLLYLYGKKIPHNITALQSYITWLQNIMDYCDVLGTGPSGTFSFAKLKKIYCASIL